MVARKYFRWGRGNSKGGQFRGRGGRARSNKISPGRKRRALVQAAAGYGGAKIGAVGATTILGLSPIGTLVVTGAGAVAGVGIARDQQRKRAKTSRRKRS